jgi:hypothetical protein
MKSSDGMKVAVDCHDWPRCERLRTDGPLLLMGRVGAGPALGWQGAEEAARINLYYRLM